MPNKLINGVPSALLHQINEFTNGGFIMFVYDSEGTPRPIGTFDSPAHALGMQNFIQTWSDAIHTFSVENMANIIAASHETSGSNDSDE